MDETSREQIVNEEHLNLLRILYFVSAGINFFAALFGILWLAIAFTMFSAARQAFLRGGAAPPEIAGRIFVGFGVVFMVSMIGIGVLKCLAARYLKERRSRVFCMAVAVITTLGFPYGSLLGVWTLMVLSRPSVSRQFDAVPAVTQGHF